MKHVLSFIGLYDMEVIAVKHLIKGPEERLVLVYQQFVHLQEKA